MSTDYMWETASCDRLDGPRIVGVLAPGATPQPAELVIRYAVWGDGSAPEDPRYLAIPLTPSGDAIEPFAHNGEAKTAAEICSDLSPALQKTIDKWRFAESAHRRAMEIIKQSNFVPVSDWKRHGWWSGYGVWQHRTISIDGETTDVQMKILPYSFSAAAEIPANLNLYKEKFPARTHVLVLPASQPRPAESIRDAKLVATILTPLTLASDYILAPPLIFVAVTVFGMT